MVKQVVIVGADGPLAALYRAQGNAVTVLSADGYSAAEAIGTPVDLLIFEDPLTPPDQRVGDLQRTALAETMRRLTFAPFRIAAILKPRLAEAGGTLALLSRATATMETPDPTGRYLDRPFRAAAHQLWRCLSVEWRDDGIDCRILGLPETGAGPEAIAAALARAATGFPVVLADVEGRTIGW